MLDADRLLPYTLAVVALILAPGPNQAMVVARSLNGGRRAGIMTSLGVNTGTAFHTVSAALGLSALLATSALAFATVKLLGAAYLLYLGIRLLAGRDHAMGPPQVDAAPAQTIRGANAYGRAIITGILNPKVALFFLAFLPQFVDRLAGSIFLQFLLLGAIIAVVGLAFDSALATAAGSLGRFLARNPRAARWRERITGTAFVALGIRLAFERR
ncbi:MAG TPA: LysE family translocator [Thermomicrobiales bacterium]|nr:LysE family translocator [Thermomicrobiales bacterium]